MLDRIGVQLPVVGAPMAGGPGGLELAAAVGRAGGLGFLAAGYLQPDEFAGQLADARRLDVPFAVNVFALSPLPVDRDEYAVYRRRLAEDAARLGIELPAGEPVEDDDHFQDKVDLLLREPVPMVSFTFGLPPARLVTALRQAGTAVLLTVTSAEEARLADELRPDGLLVQSFQGGAHYGTFDPRRLPPQLRLTDLLPAVRAVTGLPLIGAGGIANPADAAAAMAAGATAVAIGTALLRTPESGASPVHKAALADPARTTTVQTRAFTGRPARALRNGFIDRHSEAAPFGYPAVHHLTRPLRRAAAAAGDAERLHLWAGIGFRQATDRPAGEVVGELARLL
jgi:NAD(P)H-dependent flavin oxidoreductase YrpB (nitropropane dioxygenase family)